jgi:hypothetical protein
MTPPAYERRQQEQRFGVRRTTEGVGRRLACANLQEGGKLDEMMAGTYPKALLTRIWPMVRLPARSRSKLRS